MSAAQTLLNALHAPVRLEWKAKIGEGLHCVLSAELSQESAVWPPPKAILQITHDASASCSNDVQLKIPTNASPEQLETILRAGVTVLGKTCDCDASSSAAASTDQACNDQVGTVSSPTASENCTGQIQVACLQQWHHDVCGHHALYSTKCLMRGESSALLDEDTFWLNALRDITALADHGEASGRWPRSRVTCGVADECHLQYLVDSDEELKEHVTIVQDVEELREKLKDPGSSTSKSLEALMAGRQKAHGFLLGAAVHWYAAVALWPEEGSSAGSKCCPQLLFCDSYNRDFATLRSEEAFEALLNERLDTWRDWSQARLLKDTKWLHRPEEHIKRAVEEGVEEWWKGCRKSALFWRFPPSDVKRQLLCQELGSVKGYIDELTSVLHRQRGTD